MRSTITTIAIALLITGIGITSALAQGQKKAPDYSIAAIKIVPFNEQTGLFETEYTTKSDRQFFNDLSISLFVTVEIAGEVGSFEVGRKVQITVMEGKKAKLTKTEQVGLIGEGGKYHIPIWVYSSMCDKVTITAKLIGQKTASSKMRYLPFLCGE